MVVVTVVVVMVVVVVVMEVVFGVQELPSVGHLVSCRLLCSYVLILRRALNFEMEGRRPPGRPKKTWRIMVVEEDMRMLHIIEEVAMDKQQWRRLISRPTPTEGLNGR